MNQQTETDTHFAWQQQQQQLFYGPLSGTVWVSWYQKKYSPTHHPGHHAIFISFFHLPRSVASSLFKLSAWQSFAQPLSMCSLVYDLACTPPPHIPYNLYLLPLAPKNLHPLPLHYVSWIWATSTSLSASASTSSPALSVSESTFQAPIQNPNPFLSFRSSWTQPSVLAQGFAWFPHLLFAWSWGHPQVIRNNCTFDIHLLLGFVVQGR